MFHVGQKVVCINAEIYVNALPFVPMRPMLGDIYTVASIHTEPHIEGYGIRLVELPNPPLIWADGDECEWSFDHRKFRPLVEEEAALRSAGIQTEGGGK